MSTGLFGQGLGVCFSCNSSSCHHIMQGQQQMSQQAYESYLRQTMGIQQQKQTRAYIPSQEEKKSNKLLLLLR